MKVDSDVSAVVVTAGEKTLARSLACLRQQMLPLHDIIVIRNTKKPFHQGLNRGVRRVKTEFFVQCDADMLLDPDCVEVLRRYMEKDTGVAFAHLEDGLLGTIQAVKMFRTSCLLERPLDNTINPDSSRILKMAEQGHRIAVARRKYRKYGHAPDVLGRHCPDYHDPVYCFGKFSLLGSKVSSRGSFLEYKACLNALKRSQHPMADTALMAFCHGFFTVRFVDGQVGFEETKELPFMKI